MEARFCDVVTGRIGKADTRSGEEVALDVIRRAGLEVKTPDESL